MPVAASTSPARPSKKGTPSPSPRWNSPTPGSPPDTAEPWPTTRRSPPGPTRSPAPDAPARGPGIAEGPSLLIAGPTGTGKTYQAYGAIRTLLARGVRLRWEATTTADFHARLRPRAGHDAERELQTLARCPLLFLDDLGAAKTSEWTEELTYRLINHRYEQMLPTLITTNLPTEQLRVALGDRVASRLAEMTERVILNGPDRRRRTAPSV
ncbi:DNA replication protein DnaC [Streptomyces sp. DconLS]|nr:DNA replication protein DnaC [Streptomyces sp. DconLS]